ncbi:MAG: divalent-cation tolerance protein CutA [archaeon]
MSISFIYITNKDEKEASKIANHLLGKKLIACANVFPISSMFTWENKSKNVKEFALFAKTKPENFEKVKVEVKKVHSYECPCIVKFDVESNKEFEDWVRSEVV